MPLILNIDTATEEASICLAKNGTLLSLVHNEHQREHASWLHHGIEQMMKNTHYEFKDLSAVAVNAGPGSYTGLRVGMAAAKGFCYALRIPLITETSLFIMAFAASRQISLKDSLLCPMIDARRMEVFTALYHADLAEIIPPSAIILDEHSFANYLSNNTIEFFGSGAEKWQQFTGRQPNAFFPKSNADARHLSLLSHKKFTRKEFTDIVYCEPIYVKEFYTPHDK